LKEFVLSKTTRNGCGIECDQQILVVAIAICGLQSWIFGEESLEILLLQMIPGTICKIKMKRCASKFSVEVQY